MMKVFSNKNSIYCIIRQQWFNNISSEKLSDLKLVLKDCEWTKNEFELIFSPNQVYSIWKSANKKSLLSYSTTLLFSQIHAAWYILIVFAYSSIPVGFRAISMSFLSFLSQKIPRGAFKTRDYIKQKLSKKMQYLAGIPPIINLSFFKNVIKFEPLGVRG